jgi:hypothetical protein
MNECQLSIASSCVNTRFVSTICTDAILFDRLFLNKYLQIWIKLLVHGIKYQLRKGLSILNAFCACNLQIFQDLSLNNLKRCTSASQPALC